jgi:hypothetical protein
MIEANRMARLAWGTASARPLTVGFWSAHHRTGLYALSLRNGVSDRSYVATYTQVAADIPQYNVITVTGDTGGSWPTDNSTGISLKFVMASGPNNNISAANTWVAGNFVGIAGLVNGIAATSDVFRIAGVTAFPGIYTLSAAQSPNFTRFYDQELKTCKRYFQIIGQGFCGTWFNTTTCQLGGMFPVEMRAVPVISLTTTTPTVADPGLVNAVGSGSTISGMLPSTRGVAQINMGGFTGVVQYHLAMLQVDCLKADARL